MTVVCAALAIAVFLAAAMTVAWLIALRTGRSGWIDAIWSFATGIAGGAGALAVFGDGGISTRQIVVALLALLWSLRLGLHIAARATHGDDPRYAQLRQEWGAAFKQRLFWFLQAQAVAALVLALSIMIAAHNPAPGVTVFDALGVAIMIAAVIGETVADRQLLAFRRNPANRGRVCDIGLWGLSRHPNYFFEWLVWLAYAVIALDLSGAYPWGWLAFAAPTTMYWLLVHVSGIPPLEAHMLRSRGQAFEDYRRRVNAFWPSLRRGAFRSG